RRDPATTHVHPLALRAALPTHQETVLRLLRGGGRPAAERDARLGRAGPAGHHGVAVPAAGGLHLAAGAAPGQEGSAVTGGVAGRSEEPTSEHESRGNLACRRRT